MKRTTILLLALLGALLLAACGAAPEMSVLSRSSSGDMDKLAEEPQAAPGADEAAGQPAPPPVPVPAVLGRKLIREGQITLNVRDAEQGRAELERLATSAGGFVSNVQFQALSNSRSMTVSVRVPAEGFNGFLEQVRKLGRVESESLQVIDVTDQYVDLERRILTNEMLANRLEQLIREKSYQFRDLLEVERELSRLHLEREQLMGSQRGLDDRIALSTLTISLYQDVEQRVVPPDSAFAPLVNAVENAGPRFKESINALMTVLGGLITLTIYAAPWLVVLFVIGLIAWALLKALIRRSKRPKK